ncbi:hypothetical protein G5V58_03650 [Nocardioides anomalus]|uniref:Bacterial Ig-like domain-containing protein n=1 Tax=Nocardioides anomalus TaxID=2712223 RepID=A0A6G6W9H0_9ACTN|nr:Ig-like domain repeat protein [Nocardioides anomalus]QIG41988.1 hypothetical protein G5V58_03650 [Nocardioides anomalus]
MTFARLTTRVAAGGAVAALAAAGLVGATSTSATAAPVTTAYTCTSAFGPLSGTVSVDIALLPPTAPAGLAVPAGLLSFNSNLTFSNATASGLGSLGITSAKSDDFGTAFGDAVAKAPVAWTTASSDGTNTTFAGKGANAAFQLPKAGTYTVSMPKTFNLQGTNASGATVATVPCTATGTPAAIGTIALSKQESKVKANAPKAAKAGKPVSVKVKVTDDQSSKGGVLPTGKFIIKDGKKKVGKGTLDAKGQAKVKVKLGVGSHKLTVIYKGDDYNNGSTSKAKTVKVTK